MRFQPIVGDQLTGHLGGIVASRNTYGAYLKQRRSPVNRRTGPQQDQRLALQIVSSAWRALGLSVQTSWVDARATKKSRRGFTVTLTGQAFWMFVNTIRQRIGLPLLYLPPSSADPDDFTMPVTTITAPDQVSITFEAADQWNADGGGVIVSATQLLGPGVLYSQAFLAVGSALFPAAVPVVLTLPYTLPDVGGGIVRVRFHATGPDGRQTMVVDQDVTVASALTFVSRVEVIDDTHALWVFSSAISFVGGLEAHMKVGAAGPTSSVLAGPNSAKVGYATPVVVAGAAWTVPLLPNAFEATPSIAFPQAGLVT